MAVTQRPIVESALGEPSGENPSWKTIPSWLIYGDEDRNIPAGSHAFMASRAEARSTVVIPGASHVVGMSHPARAAELADAQSA